MDFQLVSNYVPAGDQPKAIDKLVQGIQAGDREQTLLGVTAVSYTHLDVYKRQPLCGSNL